MRHSGPIERRVQRNRWRRSNVARELFFRAKRRATQSGAAFNITRDDVVIPDKCPILGMRLRCHVGEGRNHPDSPSLDRINNRRGYVRGNVHVISNRANSLKSDASLHELEALVKFLRRRR